MKKMMNEIIIDIEQGMMSILNNEQMQILHEVLKRALWGKEVKMTVGENVPRRNTNEEILALFLAAKQVEGCSEKSITYYRTTLENMMKKQISL